MPYGVLVLPPGNRTYPGAGQLAQGHGRMPESDVPCVPRTLAPQIKSFQWKSGQLSHPDPPKGPDGARPWVVAAVGVALVATAAVVVLAWRRR